MSEHPLASTAETPDAGDGPDSTLTAGDDKLLTAFQKSRADYHAAQTRIAGLEREVLAMRYPKASVLYEGDALPSAQRLAVIEAQLAEAETPEPEPRIDPNNPRRVPLRRTSPPQDRLADLKAQIANHPARWDE